MTGDVRVAPAADRVKSIAKKAVVTVAMAAALSVVTQGIIVVVVRQMPDESDADG